MTLIQKLEELDQQVKEVLKRASDIENNDERLLVVDEAEQQIYKIARMRAQYEMVAE